MDNRFKTSLSVWPLHWPHWVHLVIGLWLIAAPFALGFGNYLVAGATFVCFGLIIALLAASALLSPGQWEEGVNLIVGLCLAVSPWLFGFTGERVLMAHALIAGIAVMAIAVWAILRDLPGDHWWHHPHPH